MNQSIAHVALVVRDYDEAVAFYTDRMVANGITFVRPPKVEDYGTVAAFTDLYGDLWELIEFRNP